MAYHLAQLNIARMLAPIDSPVMADFVGNLNSVNSLAESSPGFVWRLKDESNNATSIKVFDDDFMIVNMSVWKDIESLFTFTYHTAHVEVFKRKKEWFEKMSEMHMALWYVPEGHRPTVPEAQERLVYLRTHGDSPYSFTFKKKFTAAEATLWSK